jgi:hypothetical protein
MTLTEAQRQSTTIAIGYEWEYLRATPEHQYMERQQTRNVIRFLVCLLHGADFGNHHETNAVPPEIIDQIHARSTILSVASPLISDSR